MSQPAKRRKLDEDSQVDEDSPLDDDLFNDLFNECPEQQNGSTTTPDDDSTGFDFLDDMSTSDNPTLFSSPFFKVFHVAFCMSKAIGLKTNGTPYTCREYASEKKTPVDLFCLHNDANPTDIIPEGSCVLLTNDVQHLGHSFVLKMDIEIPFDASLRTLLKQHCQYILLSMVPAVNAPRIMSDEAHILAQQSSLSEYTIPHDITLEDFSHTNIFHEIDFHRVYRENALAAVQSTYVYPTQATIGAGVNANPRMFYLLNIISTEGRGKVKGKVMEGPSEQLRSNLPLRKIVLKSHYNGQQRSLPLKNIRHCNPPETMVAETIPLTDMERDNLKASYVSGDLTVPFKIKKGNCYRDRSAQGFIYCEERSSKIGKFTSNEEHILYTLFDKPHKVYLRFMY